MKLHTHHGYFHNENDSLKGALKLSKEEKAMVERITKLWDNKKASDGAGRGAHVGGRDPRSNRGACEKSIGEIRCFF